MKLIKNKKRTTKVKWLIVFIPILLVSCSDPVSNDNLSVFTIIRGCFADCIYDRFTGEYAISLDDHMDYVSEFAQITVQIACSEKWTEPLLWTIDYQKNMIFIDDFAVPYKQRDKFFYKITIIEQKW